VSVWRIGESVSLELVDGWTVTGSDLPTLEFVPAEPVGALHVTVLRSQSERADATSQARELVDRFVRDRGLGGCQPLAGFDKPGQFGVSCTTNGDRGIEWDVVAIVGCGRAVVETYAHGGSSASRRGEALQIMSSIRLGESDR
jgi:hypothetical protein